MLSLLNYKLEFRIQPVASLLRLKYLRFHRRKRIENLYIYIYMIVELQHIYDASYQSNKYEKILILLLTT